MIKVNGEKIQIRGSFKEMMEDFSTLYYAIETNEEYKDLYQIGKSWQLFKNGKLTREEADKGREATTRFFNRQLGSEQDVDLEDIFENGDK